MVDMHMWQFRRYEIGQSQPTPDAIRRLNQEEKNVIRSVLSRSISVSGMRAMQKLLLNAVFSKICQEPHVILCWYHMKSLSVNAVSSPPDPAFVARTDSRSDFHLRLAALRKERGLTQQALADRIGGHVQQLKRYEAGSSQPTLDVIRNLATALSVTSDQLLFGKDERGPDDDLRLQFEAITQFDEEEKRVVRSVLEGMILKHEARRWQNVFAGGAAGNSGDAAGRK